MTYKKITLFLFLGIFLSYGRNVNAQSQTFSYTGTVQNFSVPCANSITITATGAQGNGDNSTGGLGAKIIGTFTVTPGNVLDIMVGKEGALDPNNGAGGGGGTFIWNSSQSNALLVAAGGGGGGTVNDALTYGGGGSATTTPTSGWGIYTAAGGIGGNGGTGGSNGSGTYAGAGGGCGWLSNGVNGVPGSASNPAGGGGADPLNGGAGGIAAQNWGAIGGYGGGGGGGISGGGGGGYNGGGGGTAYPIAPSTCGGGGGGGSFNGGSNQANTAAINPGNGSVTISWTIAVLTVTDTAFVLANENTCNGLTGQARAKTTGVGLTYKWTPGGQSTDTATGLSAGSYTVAISSSCGGSASSSITITQPPNVISATASTITNILCNGGKNGSALATINGAGTPYTYLWTPSLQTTATATGLSAGIYTVQTYNICGASATATATITQPNPLAVVVKVTANIDCHGNSNGSAQSTVSGGALPYTFAWSPFGGNAANISGMPAGTYSVNVSDANGCTGSAVVNITQPASVLTTSVATTANVLCNGKSTGSASSSTKGGTTPYNYAWTGGGTKDTLVGLSVGTYTLTITDAHGCVVAEATTITQPSAVTVIAMQSPDNGNCSGAAWVMVNGGVIPYTYLWSPGSQTSAYNYGICGKDIYCCTITDAQGCKQDICDTVQNDLGVAGISSGAGKVTVYPNPNNGQFTIQSSVVSGQSSVEIYNVLGEKVFTTSLNAGGNTSININNQPNGVYLYRVLSNENGSLIGEGKLILNK